MLTWIREKFGTVIISLIIGFIAFVFVFYGVFSPKATRGLHEGAVAGKVNGDAITLVEFQRMVQQRLEFFRNIGGGNMNLGKEQIRSIKLSVLDSLLRRKLMLQEAERQGMLASDAEVKSRIQEIPAFQKDGKFSVLAYKETLQANNYTPTAFERAVREDLSVERWEEYFRRRVQVSPEEIRQNFLMSENKRDIKYVLLTQESGRKGIKVQDSEIEKYLSDPTKLNVVKNRFESQKATTYKGREFDAVKKDIVREILSGEKVDEIRKINDGLAEKVIALLKADGKVAEKDAPGKKKPVSPVDVKVNELLKNYGVEVQTTGWVSELNPRMPALGDVKELEKDAFSLQAPGGQPKKYLSGPWVIVAVVNASQSPDMAKFEKEKEKIAQQLISQKERQLSEDWYKKLREKAKIDMNPAVIGAAQDEEEG